MGVFVIYIALLTTIYYLFQHEHPVRTWNETLLIIFKVAIGVTASFEPKSTAFRILYGLGLFGGMVFSIVVNSILMRNITMPILQPQIQTIAEITTGDFKLIGDQFVLAKLIQQSDVSYNG